MVVCRASLDSALLLLFPSTLLSVRPPLLQPRVRSSKASGWPTTDIILRQLAASCSTSFRVVNGVPLAPPLLINPMQPRRHHLVGGHVLSDGSGEAGSFGEGTGGVSALLFEAYWSNGVLAIWWRAPVKPCYPVQSQLCANNSSSAPDLEAGALTRHRNSTVCRDTVFLRTDKIDLLTPSHAMDS